MKEFKNHLLTKQNIIELKLQSIIRDIETFPSPEEIDITEYGTKKQLKKMYNNELNPNPIKRIIGPTTKELQIHIRNREVFKLKKEQLQLEKKLSQINQALPQIGEYGIKGEIWPNDEIIKYILEYASQRSVNPKEVLLFLVQLCKHSKDTDKVEDKIKKNISRFFDEKDRILPDTELSTLTLLLDKLFTAILTRNEGEQYTLVINQLMVQLKVEKDETLKKATRPELEQQRKALIELQVYINGATITKALDIDEFKKLLDLADIGAYEKEEFISKMKTKIKEEQEKEQREKTLEALKRFLTDDELNLIKKAEQLEKTSIDEIRDLIKRAKEDVISMCKYLSYIENVLDMHESLDILSDRIRVLKNILSTHKNENKEPNSLYYITDKEGVPILLRNLEVHEITEYGIIYDLLYRAALGEKGRRAFEKEGYNFSYLHHEKTKLIFTDTNECRIIVGINSQNPIKEIKKYVTKDVRKQIREIETRSCNPMYRDIQATYESVILEALNVKEVGYTLSLKKEED